MYIHPLVWQFQWSAVWQWVLMIIFGLAMALVGYGIGVWIGETHNTYDWVEYNLQDKNNNERQSNE